MRIRSYYEFYHISQGYYNLEILIRYGIGLRNIVYNNIAVADDIRLPYWWTIV